jgi:hypothetical protein
MAVRKEISLDHNAEIIEELLSTSAKAPKTVSLRKFIGMNFQAFTESGKTVREIYDFLKEKEIDVGSFHVFRSVYSRVKKSRSSELSVFLGVELGMKLLTSSVTERGKLLT